MKKNKILFYLPQGLLFLSLFLPIEGGSFGQEAQTPESGTEDTPTHIEANEMLYSSKQDKAYAIGDAWALQEDKKIYADVLVAEFEEVPSADTSESASKELQRLHAKGNVRMQTTAEELTGGQEAIYTVPTEEMVVFGDNIFLKGKDRTLRAHEKLVYNKNASHALAYGDVELQMPNKMLRAPFVEAFFMPADSSGPQKKKKTKKEGLSQEASDLQLKEVYANGGVTIQTPSYISISEEAFYDSQTGKADLYGNVKINDGKNTFEGPCGQYDEKEEISKLVPCSMLQGNSKIKGKYASQKPSKTQDGRVHALLYSKNKSNK